MKNIKLKYISVFATAILMLISCESTELDLVVDPNNLSPEQSDPNFLLNNIMLDFATTWNGFNNPSRDLTRMENLFSTYNTLITTGTLDGANGEYATSYRSFANTDLLEELNNSGSDIPVHVGIAKTLQAFNLFLLVDYLGDVPFSEANNIEFEQPNVDSGEEIYQAALDLLGEALPLLNTSTINLPTSDIYYGANTQMWVNLVNTLRIRAYTNTALVNPAESSAAINAVLSNGNFIDTIDKDFNFTYTETGQPVESRHPFFTGNYLAGGATTYQSNYVVYLLRNSKSFRDPRTIYYLYRQTNADPTGQDLPCEGDAAYDYCYLGDGYWARDANDPDGLPADGTLRATYGIYPGGGAFDNDQFINAPASVNAGGAGILPILNSSFTHFMLAEGSLTNGVNGNPLDYLVTGIEQSFQKVSGFAGAPVIDAADITNYVDTVTFEYNNAVSDEERLFIIEREYFIALFGNGVEAYNMYRRTGMPINPNDANDLSNIQSPVFPAGPFPRLFFFGQGVITTNQNIEQNQLTDTVFWDNNPANFID